MPAATGEKSLSAKAGGTSVGSAQDPKRDETPVDDTDDDDESVDEDQLEEYQEMLEQLGNFAVSYSPVEFALSGQGIIDDVWRPDYMHIYNSLHCRTR
mmetsp:Transcript_39243/g.118024  ORF Transcript_39243/g.118024 Transcript_39243/m.118024 type:complete len:98 (+) Transcript_39243:155-448(+)